MSQESQGTPTPLPEAQQILDRIEELQKMLAVNSPGYEHMLEIIHRQLAKDEALTHLLTPDQVGPIVAGLARKKNIVIAEAGAKGKTASGKKLKDLGLGDLE